MICTDNDTFFEMCHCFVLTAFFDGGKIKYTT